MLTTIGGEGLGEQWPAKLSEFHLSKNILFYSGKRRHTESPLYIPFSRRILAT